MTSYISSYANRLYTAVEAEYGQVATITASNRIPAVKLTTRQRLDGAIGTGSFRLICDGMEPPELEIEETEVVGSPVEQPIEVPVGPVGPNRMPGELN